MTNSYNTHKRKRVPVIVNWLGREGLSFLQLNDEKQQKCRTHLELFEEMSANIKPQHNETVGSLQYCKLLREQSDNAEEWMGYLRIKTDECKYN